MFNNSFDVTTMQSLETTCPENDYLLNDAFCKLSRSSPSTQANNTTTTHHPLLIDQSPTQYPNLPPSPILSHNNHQQQQQASSSSSFTNKSASVVTTTHLNHNYNSSSSVKRRVLDGGGGGGGGSSTSGSPAKKSKSLHHHHASTTGNASHHASQQHYHDHHHQHHHSSATNFLSTSSATSSIQHSSSSSTLAAAATSIHDKLRELYIELLAENNTEANKLNLKNTSFLLEKLVLRDNLNTLIINLYPGNKGYSLAFRKANELNNQQETTSGGSRNNATKNQFGASTSNQVPQQQSSGTNNGGPLSTLSSSDLSNEDLQETMRWPYEEDDLLECLDNEELPLILVDLIEAKYPNLFYSGCVIAEVRDYRQSFPITTCDTYHVLLRPTNQTIMADLNLLTLDGEWSAEERLALESQLVLATSEPLCLDPDPDIGTYAINQQFRRQIFNTAPIRRQAKKFSQVSINRKRKLDQFTHNFGLELSDFMTRYRTRPRQYQTKRSVVSFTLPKKPVDVIQPIKAPNLDTPDTLAAPEKVDVQRYARSYERPGDSKDCVPQLIEEYILETDRGGGRVYHIKLSIFQRPSNSEFLGELYVDRDYRENERNGESCNFILGSRAHANRYITQFTEIFTEEGRKSVKITHIIPGQQPKVSFTAGMREHRIQQIQQQQQQQLQSQQQQQQIQVQTQVAQQQQASTQLQNVVQQQQQQQTQIHIPRLPPILAPSPNANLNTTNPNSLPGNQQQQIITGPSHTTNVINISNLTQSQLQQLQPQLFAATTATQNDGTGTVQITANAAQQFVQSAQMTGQQINIGNGSVLLVQQTPGGNITMTTNAQQHAAMQRGNNLAASVPILQAQLQAGSQQQTNQTQTMPRSTPSPQQQQIHSSNPQINALVTSFINTENQLKQQKQAQAQAQAQQQQQQNLTAAQKSNNAAIISLLNSGPAPMTSSAVATPGCGITLASPQESMSTKQATIIQQQQQQHVNAANIRKAVLQASTGGGQQSQTITANRILNHGGNLIAVSPVNVNAASLQQQMQQVIGQQQQSGDLGVTATGGQQVRVTMSALATQLASPPAIISTANLQQQNFQFQGQTQTATLISGNKTNPLILNNANAARLLNANASTTNATTTQQQLRQGIASPGSDISNTSSNNSSTNNIGFTMTNLGALLTTSPSPVSGESLLAAASNSPVQGNPQQQQNTTNAALIERLTSNTANNAGTNQTNIAIQQSQQQKQQIMPPQSPGPGQSPMQFTAPSPKQIQQIQVQSPAPSISPLSSPPPQPQTLSLQGINLANLQGAISTIPGLQNVQVQIPGIGQTVVFTTNAQNYTTLPLAQIMPSVKGINQQQIRGVTTGQNIPTSASIQLLGIQKSRNIPAQVQFAARGLVTPQRGTVKIATPISAASNPQQQAQQGNTINVTQLTGTSAALLSPQQPGTAVIATNNVATMSPSSNNNTINQGNINKNNRRRSVADGNANK